MPIEFDEGQTVVHCTGDILVLHFSPKQEVCNGVAWLLLQEREAGEIGRKPTPQQVDDKICVNEQPGVLIAADNYRSLDVIIDALSELRNELAMIEVEKNRPPAQKRVVPVEYQSGDAPTFVSNMNLKSESTHNIKGRGLVKLCEWPEGWAGYDGLMGKVVTIDGELFEVRGIERSAPLYSAPPSKDIETGEKVGLLVRHFIQKCPKCQGQLDRSKGQCLECGYILDRLPWGEVTQ